MTKKRTTVLNGPEQLPLRQAPSLADNYISRGGRLPSYDSGFASRDLLAVGSFILYHDREHVMGGVTAAEAFEAFCRLLDLPAAKYRTIIRPGDGKQAS